MADSFFDFDADMPALGAGKDGDGLQSHLTEAPPDNEIDLLNDETFGDQAVEDDAWEIEHEKIAQAGDSFFNFKAQEDELEQSINQLVVEDDEDDNQQGVSVPIKSRNELAANLDDLFGPASPPGYLRAEGLVSGIQNIWGSPATQESTLHKQQEGLDSLLKQLQTTKQNDVPFQDPSIVLSGKSMSTSLPTARTLQEIEASMSQNSRYGNGNAHQPVPAGIMPHLEPATKPRAMTVEELEAQLHSQPPPPLPNVQLPPPGHPMADMNPLMHPPPTSGTGMPNLQELEAAMRSGKPPPPLPHPPLHMPPPPLAGQPTGRAQSPATDTMPLPIGTPPQTAGFIQQAVAAQKNVGIPMPIPGSGKVLLTRAQGTPPMNLPQPSVGTPPQSQLQQRISPTNGSSTSIVDDTQQPKELSTPIQRMPAQLPFSDPTHRGSNFGVTQQLNQNSNIRQSLFANNHGRGNVPPTSVPPPGHPHSNMKDNHHGPHSSPFDFNQLYRGGFNKRGGKIPNDNHPSNRGAGHTGPRGDYLDDYHQPFHNGNRGALRGGMGDSRGYHHHGYDDNFHHNNRGGGRGDFNGGRGDFRNNRGYHEGGPRRGYDQNRDYEHYDYREGGDYHRRGNAGGRGGFQPRTRHDSFGYDYDDDYEEAIAKDPYARLMTKKEKDWIIKIQLMQLQTDNPYLDDYYYAAWQVKKIAEEQRKKQGLQNQSSTDSEPKLVIPKLAGRLENRSYKPVQFENSLGRLTAASVHNPRHIIDFKANKPADTDENTKELRRYKELLLHVEKSYDLLLDIDDLEKRAVVLPDEARPPLLEEREKNISLLYQRVLHQSNQAKNFSKLVVVRKGLKLIARLIPLLQLNDATDLVCELLGLLGAISKKDWQKDVLPPVFISMSHVINMANLETLVRFADTTRIGNGQEDSAMTIASALQNPFGSSVIWCLVNRGEHVYATESPLDMAVEHQNAWSEFVSVVAEALAVMSKDQVATPKGSFKAVAHHFERLIDKRTFISIEDKLQQLQNTRAS